MAQDTDDTTKANKRGKNSKVLVWVLMAMVIGGLGGFGVQNFGGGISSIGTVAGQEMTTSAYARALRNELNAMSQQFGTQLTLSQAAPFGVTERALQGLISSTALDAEMLRVGLSAGDGVVADQIASIESFQNVSGVFDAATYRDTLSRNNMSEKEYEDSLRRDIARQMLTAAIIGGFQVPQPLTENLYAWVAERRGFSLLTLTSSSLPQPLPAPTEAELATYYQDHIADFTRGEAKRLTYVALLPDTLAPTLAVDEAAVQALYDARIADYVIPEKRLAERLVYPDQAAAEAALANLAAGKGFDDLVAARNLTLEDVDLGDVTRGDLGAAADAVFALRDPGSVSAVVATDLGPAIFRVNAVIEAQETPFAEVRDALALELQGDAARRAISERTEGLNDLLAGGATLEDLAKEDGMVLAQTDYVPGADDNAEIASYNAFRKAAEALAAGDYPELIGLEDGGIVALRLDEILPPTPIPQAQVADRLAEAWQADQLASALAELAQTRKTEIEAGADMGAMGILTVSSSAEREAQVSDAPAGLMAAVFALQPGEVQVLIEGTQVAVLRLDTVTPAATEGEDATATKAAISGSLAQSLSRDALVLFTQSLVNGAGLQLDQAAVNAVQASFN